MSEEQAAFYGVVQQVERGNLSSQGMYYLRLALSPSFEFGAKEVAKAYRLRVWLFGTAYVIPWWAKNMGVRLVSSRDLCIAERIRDGLYKKVRFRSLDSVVMQWK